MLAVYTIVSKGNQSLVIYFAFLLQKAVDGVEELIGDGLDLWSSVGVGGVDIEAVLFGRVVAVGEGDVGDFKAFGDDGVDNHRVF